MGDLPGHEFRGNQWTVGKEVHVIREDDRGNRSVSRGTITSVHGGGMYGVTQQQPDAPIGTPVVRMYAHESQLHERASQALHDGHVHPDRTMHDYKPGAVYPPGSYKGD